MLLPLPLQAQAVCGLLALRSLLPRMRALAAARAAAAPGAAAQCRHVFAGMRAAMQFVACGRPVPMPEPAAALTCWMLHVWTVVALGFCLPTAVAYALHRHQRQQQAQPPQQQQAQQQGAGQQHAAASDASQAGTDTTCSSLHSPGREAAAGEPAAAAAAAAGAPELAAGPQGTSPATPASLGSLSPDARLAALLPPARPPSLRSVCSAGSSRSGQRAALGPSLPVRVLYHPATELTGELTRCLVLTLPVWAIVWASLELLVQFR